MVAHSNSSAPPRGPHDDIDIYVRVRRPVTICRSSKLKEIDDNLTRLANATI